MAVLLSFLLLFGDAKKVTEEIVGALAVVLVGKFIASRKVATQGKSHGPV